LCLRGKFVILLKCLYGRVNIFKNKLILLWVLLSSSVLFLTSIQIRNSTTKFPKEKKVTPQEKKKSLE